MLCKLRLLVFCILVALLAGCTATSPSPSLPTGAPSPLPMSPATRETVGPVRQPVVAGQFYPASPNELRQMVQALLRQVHQVQADEPPLALIVPHAGYVYSGAVAARAYAQIVNRPYAAVVVLGTNHTLPSLTEAAIYPQGAFATPLGEVLVDATLAQEIIQAVPDLLADPRLHDQEHSIEVQLPFLQVACPDTPIVPLIVGDLSPEKARRLGEALATVLRGRQMLIVATSDLSHYPSYTEACRVDGQTVKAIASLDPLQVAQVDRNLLDTASPSLACTMCGRGAILTALAAARSLGAEEANLLLYANSGDQIFGDRKGVVGYAAFGIWPAGVPGKPSTPPVPCQLEEEATARELTEEEQQQLLAAARETLEWYLEARMIPLEVSSSAALYQHSGAFVTLKKAGELRGCIGNVMGQGPLILTVQRMAIAAATEDQRFPPVNSQELSELRIEVSILSPLQEVASPEAIQVGQHGVVLVQGKHQGVFLPQVATEEGWDRETMLNHLAEKAGLPPNGWRQPGTRFYIFTAQVFEETRP
ncbi:MAG: AmmeMemoRadiSam system protein B [Anaerolineae bacterium]